MQADLASEKANGARVTAALEAAVHRLRHADSAERWRSAEQAACHQDFAAIRASQVLLETPTVGMILNKAAGSK